MSITDCLHFSGRRPKIYSGSSGKYSLLVASGLVSICILCNDRVRHQAAKRATHQRYYEGLFVICPLELKREFHQLDLTEGERNECVWNSPSRKAYGRSERAVHGLRTE